MDSFVGFVTLGDNLLARVLTRDGDTPKDSTSNPAVRVYGPEGLMQNSDVNATHVDTGSITGASNASPIVVTSAGHNLATGTRVTISGVGGNTAANGDFQITVIDADTFSLDGSTGNGAYTSGGSWHVTGLYEYTIEATAANGYEEGETYTALWTATVGATVVSALQTFTVV